MFMCVRVCVCECHSEQPQSMHGTTRAGERMLVPLACLANAVCNVCV